MGLEEIIGIKRFLSKKDGIKGVIKTNLKDFIVIEKYIEDHINEGKYAIFLLKKKNRNTIEVIEELANKLDLRESEIGFAGIKDKRSISLQRISLPRQYVGKVKGITLKKAKLFFLGYRKEKIKKGCLLGNLFIITIRHAKKENIFYYLEEGRNSFINYFGPQRFGSLRPIMHIIGKCIIKGKLEEAIRFYLGLPFLFEPEETKLARENFLNEENPKKSLKEFPKNLVYERRLLSCLVKKQDYKKCFFAFPRNLQRLFVDAYQSYLFNLFASSLIGKRNYTSIPGYKIKNLQEEEKEVLEREGVSLEDFKKVPFSYLKSKGKYRKIIEKPEEFCLLGKDPIRLKFFLRKGVYATSFLRELMKEDVFFLEFTHLPFKHKKGECEKWKRKYFEILKSI